MRQAMQHLSGSLTSRSALMVLVALLLLAAGCQTPAALTPTEAAAVASQPDATAGTPATQPATRQATAGPTAAPSPSAAPALTATLTAPPLPPTVTSTPSPAPTATPTPTATATPAPTATATATPSPSATVAPATPAPAPTATHTRLPPVPTTPPYRFVPSGAAQPDLSHPCPGCPRAPAFIVGRVTDAAGNPLPGVRLVCYNDWHRYPVVATKGGGEYDFNITQAETTWYVVVLDEADRPSSPEAAVPYRLSESCRYILNWQRTD